LRVLKKLNKIIPHDLKINGVDILWNVMNELDEANNIVKLLKEKPTLSWKEFLEEYKWKFGKSPKLLGDIENISKESLKSVIANKISNIWWDLDRQISTFRSDMGKTFKWITATEATLDNLSKHVKKTTWFLSDVVKNDSLFNRTRSQLKKLWLTTNMMEIDPFYDRAVFKFKDVKTAKDFFGNLWKLAKQSPELLWFLFDKTPIFLVAWLSAAKWDSLVDFAKQLMYLIPLFGSGFMLIDALKVDNPDLTQVGISSVLLASETGYITYQLWVNWLKDGWKNVFKYILKPWRDVLEIAWFISRTWFTTVKVSSDALKLITKWKITTSELSKLLEKTNFSKLWELLKDW